jgi:hypothetical protein
LRSIAATSLALVLLVLAACGGGNSPTPPANVLTGNWQMNLLQEEPRPQNSLSVSGFLVQASEALTGSVQVPAVAAGQNCGGVSVLNGTINGQNVTFSINEGGTALNFTGTIASNNQSMAGDYEGPGGGCFTTPTSGSWSALLIPPLNGSFTGTLANSSYMTLVNGVVPPVPISVTGKLTQSANTGESNAALTGTITASGYPCFTTVSVTGTISGANVILALFSYNDQQIGTIGLTNAPATISLESSGFMLTGVGGTSGLRLGGTTPSGSFGPCPAVFNQGGALQSYDNADVAFSFQ